MCWLVPCELVSCTTQLTSATYGCATFFHNTSWPQSLQDGNNVNNIITVLPADSTEALVTARLLSPTGAHTHAVSAIQTARKCTDVAVYWLGCQTQLSVHSEPRVLWRMFCVHVLYT
jgi:hypothetical protein